MNSLKEIFDVYAKPNLRLDKRFIDSVWKWKTSFYSRNPDHIGFFTGYYFGYHIPKWTYNDTDHWLYDVLGIDEDEVASHAHKLPFVDKDHAVSSNILSIGLLYIIHLASIDKSLNDKDRDNLRLNILEIMIARYLTAIFNNYFSRGTTSLDIAQEVHNRLSKKFVLKQEGSWSGFIKARAQSFLYGNDQGSASRRKFATEDVYLEFTDEQVVRKLNSIKTNLNQAIRDINAVFRQVLEDQTKIETTSSTQSDGEGLFVKDLIKQDNVYLTYQSSIFIDKRTFIKEELLDVIESSMDVVSTKIFRGALEWIIENQNDKKYRKDIEHLRTEILAYGLDLIREEGIKVTDFVQIAYRLRQNFMSGKSNDIRLQKCRKICDKMIVAYRPKSRGKVITQERVSILMYIVLRSLLMQS